MKALSIILVGLLLGGCVSFYQEYSEQVFGQCIGDPEFHFKRWYEFTRVEHPMNESELACRDKAQRAVDNYYLAVQETNRPSSLSPVIIMNR